MTKDVPIFDTVPDVMKYINEHNPDKLICALPRKDGILSLIVVNYDDNFMVSVIEGLMHQFDQVTDIIEKENAKTRQTRKGH